MGLGQILDQIYFTLIYCHEDETSISIFVYRIHNLLKHFGHEILIFEVFNIFGSFDGVDNAKCSRRWLKEFCGGN